jgi:hypothetical protein
MAIVTKYDGNTFEIPLKANELNLLSKILSKNEKVDLTKHNVSDKFYEFYFCEN